MTAGPTVRLARPEEYHELARLTEVAYRALLGDLDGPYLAELRGVAARAVRSPVLVAVGAGDRVLGGVTYVAGPGPLATLDDPSEAAIRFLAVAPDAQGRGTGTALVTACVDLARTGGKRRLCLHTTPAMTVAQRLYERVGFRRDPGRDRELDSGLLLLAYVLELTG